MEHYKFFQNRDCEYFPCHRGVDREQFNCLFCYCPLYSLGNRCGGNFVYLENGVKDCTNCLRAHCPGSYEWIVARIGAVMELAKKPGENP